MSVYHLLLSNGQQDFHILGICGGIVAFDRAVIVYCLIDGERSLAFQLPLDRLLKFLTGHLGDFDEADHDVGVTADGGNDLLDAKATAADEIR